MVCRLGHQVGLRAEVFVEATVREARGGHQIGHTNAIEAAFAKQLGRRLDDVRPIGLCLSLGDLHGVGVGWVAGLRATIH